MSKTAPLAIITEQTQHFRDLRPQRGRRKPPTGAPALSVPSTKQERPHRNAPSPSYKSLFFARPVATFSYYSSPKCPPIHPNSPSCLIPPLFLSVTRELRNSDNGTTDSNTLNQFLSFSLCSPASVSWAFFGNCLPIRTVTVCWISVYRNQLHIFNSCSAISLSRLTILLFLSRPCPVLPGDFSEAVLWFPDSRLAITAYLIGH